MDAEPVAEHQLTSSARAHRLSIGVGDEVSAVGLFTRFAYEDRHVPFVRSGKLAMLPTLSIPVRNFEPMEAYVSEMGGLRGSPVWVREKDERASSADARFLGMMHGPWELSDGAMQGLSAQYTYDVTSGMSIIVPAPKILEVINQPDLAALRKKSEGQEVQFLQKVSLS